MIFISKKSLLLPLPFSPTPSSRYLIVLSDIGSISEIQDENALRKLYGFSTPLVPQYGANFLISDKTELQKLLKLITKIS